MTSGQMSKRRCCFPECEDEFEDKQLLIDHILIEHRQKPVNGSYVVFNLDYFTPASIREVKERVKEREDRIKQNSNLPVSQHATCSKPQEQIQVRVGHSSGNLESPCLTTRKNSDDTQTAKTAVSSTSDMSNPSIAERKSDQAGRGNKNIENVSSRNHLSNNIEPSGNLHGARKECSTKSSSYDRPRVLIPMLHSPMTGVRVISRTEQIKSKNSNVDKGRTQTATNKPPRSEDCHSIQDTNSNGTGGSIDPKRTGPIDPKCTGPIDPTRRHTGPIDPKHTGPIDPKHTGPIDPKHTGPIDPKRNGPIDPKRTGFVPKRTGSVYLNRTGSVDPKCTGPFDTKRTGDKRTSSGNKPSKSGISSNSVKLKAMYSITKDDKRKQVGCHVVKKTRCTPTISRASPEASTSECLARDGSNDIQERADITLQDVQTHSNAKVHSADVQVTNCQSSIKQHELKRLACSLSSTLTETKSIDRDTPEKKNKLQKKNETTNGDDDDVQTKSDKRLILAVENETMIKGKPRPRGKKNWIKISKVVKLSRDVCELRWRCLRDKYVRCVKQPKDVDWPLFDMMDFVKYSFNKKIEQPINKRLNNTSAPVNTGASQSSLSVVGIESSRQDDVYDVESDGSDGETTAMEVNVQQHSPSAFTHDHDDRAFDEKLIRVVEREYRIPRKKDGKARIRAPKDWSKISGIMKAPRGKCIKRWVHLRAKYVRYLDRKGDLNWPLAESMRFVGNTSQKTSKLWIASRKQSKRAVLSKTALYSSATSSAVTQDNEAVTQDNEAVTQDNEAVTQDNEAVTQDNETVTPDSEAVTQKSEDFPPVLQMMDCENVTTRMVVAAQCARNDTSSLSGAVHECIDQTIPPKIGLDEKCDKYGMTISRVLRAMTETERGKAILDINAVLFNI